MHRRKRFVAILCSLCALGLLTIAVLEQSRPAAGIVSTGPDGPHRRPARSPVQAVAGLIPAPVAAAVCPIDVLPVEEEEQDRADVWDQPRACFSHTGSFRKVAARRLVPLRSPLPAYPLRC